MCSVCFPGPACSGQVMPNYENYQKEKKMKQKKHKSLLHSSSLYILLTFAILLTGCGSKGEERGETQSDVQAEEQTEPSAAEFLKEDGTADIQALQAINAEAYAWLEITGTDISFPILQPAED